MEKLNVRFSEKTRGDIEFASKAGDYTISKSLVARAAISLGLQEIELARTSMSHDDFVNWLDSNQEK